MYCVLVHMCVYESVHMCKCSLMHACVHGSQNRTVVCRPISVCMHVCVCMCGSGDRQTDSLAEVTEYITVALADRSSGSQYRLY